MTHQLPAELLHKPVRVLVIGCGGKGSAIAGGLPYLSQAMLVSGHPHGLEMAIMDGDVVSATKCVRQPFSHAGIGNFKAVVLVSRINRISAQLDPVDKLYKNRRRRWPKPEQSPTALPQ